MTSRETEAPEIDVVILSIDRTEDTLEAIGSAAAQEGVRLRIFLVDQGSRGAHAVAMDRAARSEPRLSVHRLEKNLGVPGGRNLGAALGSAPFICFLDNDAVLADKNVLLRAAAHLVKEPALAVVALRVLLADSGEDQNQHWLHPGVAWHGDLEDSVEVSRFIGAGCLLRRQAFTDVGGFDDAFFFLEEETDLSYRLLNANWRLRCFADLKVLHKASPLHRRGWRDFRFYYLVRNDLYGRYKRGAGLPLLLLRATGHLVRGFGAGLGLTALRALSAAFLLCLRYRWRTPAAERRRHVLRPAVQKRIARLEGHGRLSRARLLKAVAPLPQGRN